MESPFRDHAQCCETMVKNALQNQVLQNTRGQLSDKSQTVLVLGSLSLRADGEER